LFKMPSMTILAIKMLSVAIKQEEASNMECHDICTMLHAKTLQWENFRITLNINRP
jgi:hypothetical protein